MTHPSRSCLKSFSSFLLTAAILTVTLVALESKAFAQKAGKGASSNDWFIKSAKDRNEKLQTGI